MQLSNYAGVHVDLRETVGVRNSKQEAGYTVYSPMSFTNDKYCCSKLSLTLWYTASCTNWCLQEAVSISWMKLHL